MVSGAIGQVIGCSARSFGDVVVQERLREKETESSNRVEISTGVQMEAEEDDIQVASPQHMEN